MANLSRNTLFSTFLLLTILNATFVVTEDAEEDWDEESIMGRIAIPGPCKTPAPPKSSRMKCRTRIEEVKCKATCLEGFEFEDKTKEKIILCTDQSPGVWSETIPDCKGICEIPCENGGRCVGNNKCACAGQYRGSHCQYSTKLCELHKMNFNGEWSCNHTQEGTLCKIGCPQPFYFSFDSPSEIYCSIEGIWSQPQVPECIADDPHLKLVAGDVNRKIIEGQTKEHLHHQNIEEIHIIESQGADEEAPDSFILENQGGSVIRTVNEEEERRKREEEERLIAEQKAREEQERIRIEEEERLRIESERFRQEEEYRLQEEERLRIEKEQLRIEEERRIHEEEERLERVRVQQEEEHRIRLEEQRRIEEELRLKEELRQQLEEEERRRYEEEEQRRVEENRRLELELAEIEENKRRETAESQEFNKEDEDLINFIQQASGVCRVWGINQLLTFHGKFSVIQSRCPYILSKECNAENGLVVLLEIRGECTNANNCEKIIRLKNQGHVAEISTSNLVVESLSAVVNVPGLTAQMAGMFLVIRSTSGISIYMSTDTVYVDSVQDSTSSFCGICGTKISPNDNDVLTDNTESTWKDNECNAEAFTEEACSDEGHNRCNDMTTAVFKECSKFISPTPFVSACRTDCCRRGFELGCECASIAAFVAECRRLSGSKELARPVELWRTEQFCPIECSGGSVYSECGPACEATCQNPEPLCPLLDCVPGCHCPKDLVKHNGKCIPRDACSCSLDGIAYNEGQQINKDCNQCVCTGGQWECSTEVCDATCSVLVNGLYQTFDQRHFHITRSKTCSFILLDTKYLQVVQDYRHCPSGDVGTVCIGDLYVHFLNGSLEIRQGPQILLNGREVHLTPFVVHGEIIVSVPVPNFVKIDTGDVSISTDTESFINIKVTRTLFGVTQGLCGTFDHNPNNDFHSQSDSELAIASAVDFAKEWATHPNCADIMLMECSTMSVIEEEKTRRHAICNHLLGDIFADCHRDIPPEVVYELCLSVACSCTSAMDQCLCPILSHYAGRCSKITDKTRQWRQHVSECRLTCNSGMVYDNCVDFHNSTCGQISYHSNTYAQPLESATCVDACICPFGSTLDHNGQCTTSCECLQGQSLFPDGSERLMGSGSCSCRTGKWSCVEREGDIEQNIVTPVQQCDPIRERFSECVSECAPTCRRQRSQTHYRCLEEICVAGCECAEGFIRDEISGKCVKLSECPCKHGSTSYNEGSVIMVNCNQCQCRDGSWQCTKQNCASTCTMWGENHIRTFDGKIFDFSGTCEYLLAAAADSDDFSIVVQTVKCGSLQTITCPKTIVLNIGSKKYILHKHVYHNETFEDFTVEDTGLMIKVAINNGITLLWDKHTRIHIVADPQWKNKMRGLCGDYDADAINDFKSSANGPVLSDVIDFVKAYELSQFCEPPKHGIETCQVPERHRWARDTCKVLLGETFEACHSHVDPAPYYQRCVADACACDQGGDCECLCTAIAVYAHECSQQGVVISWRHQELCPIQCDAPRVYYSQCMLPHQCHDKNTCEYIQYHGLESVCRSHACIEGCSAFRDCLPGYVRPSLDSEHCVEISSCPNIGFKSVCYIDGRLYHENEEISSSSVCHKCICIGGAGKCSQVIPAPPGCDFNVPPEFTNPTIGPNPAINLVTDSTFLPIPDNDIIPNYDPWEKPRNQQESFPEKITTPRPPPNPYGPLPINPNLMPLPQPFPFPMPEPMPLPIPGPFPVPMPEPMPIPGLFPFPMPQPMPLPGPFPLPMPEPMPIPGPFPFPMPEPMPLPGPFPFPMPEPMPLPGPFPVPMPQPFPIPKPDPFSTPIPGPFPGPLPFSEPTSTYTTPLPVTTAVGPESCPNGAPVIECAFECHQTCQSYRVELMMQGKCFFEEPDCVASCSPQTCPEGHLLAGDGFCVPVDRCACVIAGGEVLQPGQSFRKDECIICECKNNEVICRTVGDCVTTTPASGDLVIETEMAGYCWSEWFNSDSAGGAGDFEELDSLQSSGKVCLTPANVQCETTDGLSWKQLGQEMTCSLTSGLACWNSANGHDGCKDYRIRYYCPCESNHQTEGGFKCPEANGLFPDPGDCGWFYHCSNNFPHHKICPGNLHFNPNLLVCDWPHNAGCESGGVYPTERSQTEPRRFQPPESIDFRPESSNTVTARPVPTPTTPFDESGRQLPTLPPSPVFPFPVEDQTQELVSCQVVGQHFKTFGGAEFDYDFCHHVIVEDKINQEFIVSLHRNCGQLSGSEGYECDKYVELQTPQATVVFRFDGSVKIDGVDYNPTQLLKLAESIQPLSIQVFGSKTFVNYKKNNLKLNLDTVGTIRVELSSDYVNGASGLCGFYTNSPGSDLIKGDGSVAKNIEEFGDSWSIADKTFCQPFQCPSDMMIKAKEACAKLRSPPLNDCEFAQSAMQQCEAQVCGCLVSPGGLEQQCACDSYQVMVHKCGELAREVGNETHIDRGSWRAAYGCVPECPPSQEYQDCGPSCLLTCDNFFKGQTTCPGAEECVSGCFCPPGKVLDSAGHCRLPDQCADKVCTGYGDPQIETFDGWSFNLQASGEFNVASDKLGAFKVKGISDKCLERATCIVGLDVSHNKHTAFIRRNQPIIIDGLPYDSTKLPWSTDDKAMTIFALPGSKMIVVSFNVIGVQVRYSDVDAAFSVHVPSKDFFNQLEGLCGNCNNDPNDDNTMPDGSSADSIQKLVCSWGIQVNETHCALSITGEDNFIPGPIKEMCSSLLEHGVFGQCHRIVEVNRFVSQCEKDAVNSVTSKEAMCATMMAYARRCCQEGVTIQNWWSYFGCNATCPGETEYFMCHNACPQTCQSYKKEVSTLDKKATKPKETKRSFVERGTCDTIMVDGCFCPEDKVLVDGTCRTRDYCETCDAEGHRVGESWLAGACTKCTCRADRRIDCTQLVCPPDPSCAPDERLVPITTTGPQGEKCCVEKRCQKFVEACNNITMPLCQPGEVSKVTADSTGCPMYYCQCDPALCPPVVWPNHLNMGEQVDVVPEGCCGSIEVVCHPELCPEKPTCPPDTTLQSFQGPCCLEYACRPPHGTCLYAHQYEIRDGGEYQLDERSQSLKTYRGGESWQDGICRNCTCQEHESNQFSSRCTVEKCVDLKDLPDNEDYMLTALTVKGRCCPVYKRLQCKDGYGNPMQPGAEWQSKLDTCRTEICEGLPNGEVRKVSRSTICPPCPQHAEAIPPEDGECCGKCRMLQCEEAGQWYPAGSTWNSATYKCFKAECVRDGDMSKILYKSPQCPPIPDGCPTELLEWDEDRCCQRCMQSGPFTTTGCQAKLMQNSSAGAFTYQDPKHGICVNTEPVSEAMACSGGCSSYSFFKRGNTDEYASDCTCCVPEFWKPVRVFFTCVDGEKLSKYINQPTSCKCLPCGGVPLERVRGDRQIPTLAPNTPSDDHVIYRQNGNVFEVVRSTTPGLRRSTRSRNDENVEDEENAVPDDYEDHTKEPLEEKGEFILSTTPEPTKLAQPDVPDAV